MHFIKHEVIESEIHTHTHTQVTQETESRKKSIYDKSEKRSVIVMI